MADSRQIAGALDCAHSQDVVHRDVKPASILLSSDRQNAYLTDFGIAQLVDDAKPLGSNGRVEGSIASASPELIGAQQLSPATDSYALACTMAAWLTGQPPYPRSTPFASYATLVFLAAVTLLMCFENYWNRRLPGDTSPADSWLTRELWSVSRAQRG